VTQKPVPASVSGQGPATGQRRTAASTAITTTAAECHQLPATGPSAEQTSTTAPPVVRIEGLWHVPRAVPLSCQNGRGLTGNRGTARHSAPDAPETAKPLVTRASAQPRP
jgi:hypothetical protein